jgi:hypothetical protein
MDPRPDESEASKPPVASTLSQISSMALASWPRAWDVWGSFKGLHFLFDIVVNRVCKATVDSGCRVPVRLNGLLHAPESVLSGWRLYNRQILINGPFGHREAVCMALDYQPTQDIQAFVEHDRSMRPEWPVFQPVSLPQSIKPTTTPKAPCRAGLRTPPETIRLVDGGQSWGGMAPVTGTTSPPTSDPKSRIP